MRRVHLRGHPNVRKRLLVHVAGCNLGLLLRQMIRRGLAPEPSGSPSRPSFEPRSDDFATCGTFWGVPAGRSSDADFVVDDRLARRDAERNAQSCECGTSHLGLLGGTLPLARDMIRPLNDALDIDLRGRRCPARDHASLCPGLRSDTARGLNRVTPTPSTTSGSMYATGLGVPQDDAEAGRWYRLAAEQGEASAQYNLGVRYDRGLGVLQDHAEAARWYRLAAEQGNASASSTWGLRTTTVRAYRGTPRKPSGGTASPPSRVTPTPSTTSGSCTPTVGAFRRTTYPRTCG